MGLMVGRCIHLVSIIYHTEIVWKLILPKEWESVREREIERERE